MSRNDLPERRIFRATSATISLIVAGVAGALVLGDALVRGGLGQTLLLAPWVLLIVWVVYAVVYVPRVEMDAEGITVVNVLRTTRVPWPRVTDMDTRWQLVVHLDDGSRVGAFGGPSLRRSRSRSAQQSETPFSDMALIRGEWDAARDAGVPAGPVQRRWNGGVVVSLVVLVASAGASAMIAGAGA
ncbi:PH domain-containing protein [Microbacterium sp. zg-YB36]|uniref:PH domain-containing protein n=1 Tax=Microbacterium sp. zg-YB36 TaxID=2969407 RepID=UPI00214B0FEB|nr:PH domain-containing protein [Microbacterium sp. zg-YB36]MDL5350650.1 PH domain-containing protein [Microbacterium sp. zg-YB36]